MEDRKPRLFKLIRHKDVKNISGVGKVIDGVMFKDGKIVVQWQTRYPSIGIFNSLEDFVQVHAKPFFKENEFRWIDGYEPSDELDQALDEIADYVMRKKAGIQDKCRGDIVAKVMAYKKGQAKLRNPMERRFGSLARLTKEPAPEEEKR